MVLRFISEKSAEEFIKFVADRYEVELSLDSYLHVEISSEDFDDDDVLYKLIEEAEEFGVWT